MGAGRKVIRHEVAWSFAKRGKPIAYRPQEIAMGVMFGQVSLFCRLSCGHDISVSTSYECRSSKRVPLVLKVRASGAIENERSPPRPSFPPCYHSRMPRHQILRAIISTGAIGPSEEVFAIMFATFSGVFLPIRR